MRCRARSSCRRDSSIVVEILSASTRARGEIHKRAIYARQQVPFYFIVDPDSNRLTLLELIDDQFEQKGFGSTVELTICATCKLVIDVPSIFS